ncbi:MAG: transpeptidase family protein [Muribaculaceae bacterium]|nr:transpeptidase family protein [Muribaculaceae bacterium]
MAAAKNKNNKSTILFRYGIITFGFLLFAAVVVSRLFTTTVIEAPEWNARAKKDFSRIDTLKPERGDILANNGNILACNLKVYDVKVDLRHNKVQRRKLIWAQIDSLADSLDRYYPRIPNLMGRHPDTIKKYSWHTRLKREFEKAPDRRPRALRFIKGGTLQDFERIKAFPYLRDFKGRGFRNPVYVEERNVRIYPYGRMAYRSIGRVNENIHGEFHGYSGLEKDLDSLLYGKEGYAKKVTLTSGVSNWVTRPTQRGLNVQTTIDIDLQDMLEEQLLRVCMDANAEWGTAILMEVATGEIKAIANLENINGEYGEALNRAVRGFEPGSVMKPISLMIAFEDGLVKSVNDVVDCSTFQRTSDPHAPTVKSMKQVIEMSSNTGIARVIFRGYANDPARFYDRLEKIGFFEPMHSGIAAEETPRVRRLTAQDARGNNITMTSRHLDLARQAYGYNTTIPPLYTLAYYNAIANGGRLVRPHLMKRLIGEGVDSVLKIDYIREQICSPETAEKVKICLREPVWGDHGTARAVRDERVMIAGKTGTAYPVHEHGGGYDISRRRYAFAGFFPYDNPKYSCIALILAPSGTSANRTSGQVVKNMALKMYSRGMLDNASTFTGSRLDDTPIVAASTKGGAASLGKALGASGAKTIKTENPGHNIAVKAMPNVMGYDAPSAIRILEQQGVNVRIRGAGRVVSQSIPPGAALNKGTVVTLFLKV